MAFWAIFAAINGSGEEEQNSKIIHIKLLFGLLGRISAKSSTNRIRDECIKHCTTGESS